MLPFRTIDWDTIPVSEHPGIGGVATWKTADFSGLRIRIVDYPAGYMADHWCRKGHIVHCLSGAVTSEMEEGGSFDLREGMTYVVSDEMSSHRSRTKDGVRLLIIDGDFLK